MKSSYESSYYKRLSLNDRSGTLILLIAISAIIFVVLGFFKAVSYLNYYGEEKAMAVQNFNDNVLVWFAMPGSFKELLVKPWTFFTHAFTHTEFWLLLANMLWLWTFGYILQNLTGNRKLVPLYIYGSLIAATVYLLLVSLVPAFAHNKLNGMYYGASAGVLAIATAATTIAPQYRLLHMLNGGIPLWILTAIYLVIDFATIPVSGAGLGHIVHLSAALTGVLFIVLLRKGFDGSDWMNNLYDWFINLLNPDKPKKGETIKETLFYKSPATPYTKTPNLTQQRIDGILDKINQEGYDALTKEEKELLNRASQEGL